MLDSMNEVLKIKKSALRAACELLKILTLLVANCGEENENEYNQYFDMIDMTVNAMVDLQSCEMNQLETSKLLRFLKYNLTEAKIEITNQAYRLGGDSEN